MTSGVPEHTSPHLEPPVTSTPSSPQGKNIIRVGEYEIEITSITLNGKEYNIGSLNPQELVMVQKLFADALTGQSLEADFKKGLDGLRIKINPHDKEATLVKEKGAKALDTIPLEFREGEFESKIKDSYDKFIDVFENSTNIEKMEDEYSPLDLRIPPEARKMAREKGPIVCTYYRDGTQVEGPPAAGKPIYGEERIDKFQAVHEAAKMAKVAIRHFEGVLTKLKSESEGESKRSGMEEREFAAKKAYCEREIAHHKKMLGNIQRHIKWDDKGWLDCNYWRFLVRDCTSYTKAIESYISAPVNLRYQKMTMPDASAPGGVKEVGFARVGVMADMRNTWYSLEFLKQIEALDERIQANAAKIKELEDRNDPMEWKELNELRVVNWSLDERRGVLLEDKVNMILSLGGKKVEGFEDLLIKEIPGYKGTGKKMDAIKKHSLIRLEGYIKAIKGEIERLEQEGDFDQLEKKNRLESMLNALQELQSLNEAGAVTAVEGRRRILRDKMLHLVAAQVKNNPGMALKDVFKMVHVGLVNGASAKPKSGKFDATGWMHNEAIEMEDMAAIFAEFDGKSIIFDSPTPFIDEKGAIHLPEVSTMAQQIPPRQTVLRAFYVNVTPQGNTSNVDKPGQPGKNIQKKINDRAIVKLKAELHASGPPRESMEKEAVSKALKHERILKELDFRDGSFEKSEDVALAFLESGEYAVSIGCASAKDRTGVVGERLMMRALQGTHAELAESNPFSSHILDANVRARPAIRVVYENTGEDALKADPRIRGIGGRVTPNFSLGVAGRLFKVTKWRQWFPAREMVDYKAHMRRKFEEVRGTGHSPSSYPILG